MILNMIIECSIFAPHQNKTDSSTHALLTSDMLCPSLNLHSTFLFFSDPSHFPLKIPISLIFLLRIIYVEENFKKSINIELTFLNYGFILLFYK